jgi:hypothetical protein
LDLSIFFTESTAASSNGLRRGDALVGSTSVLLVRRTLAALFFRGSGTDAGFFFMTAVPCLAMNSLPERESRLGINGTQRFFRHRPKALELWKKWNLMPLRFFPKFSGSATDWPQLDFGKIIQV